MNKKKILSIIAIVMYVSYFVMGMIILFGVLGSFDLLDGELITQDNMLFGLSGIIAIDLKQWHVLIRIFGWALLLVLLVSFGFIYAVYGFVCAVLKVLTVTLDKKPFSVACLIFDGALIILNAEILYKNSKALLFAPTVFLILWIMSLICCVLNVLCVIAYRKKGLVG